MSKRRRHRLTAQAGFTMIEVMVSVLLTAVAASGLIGLYIVQSRASGYSRHATEATVLAQDQLERLRTSSYVGGPAIDANITETGATGGIYTRSSTVTAGVAFIVMQVSVSWPEDTTTKSITLYARKNLTP